MSENKIGRVFLIDAMAHIYRAFFAMMGNRQEPLRTSDGQVTHAVYIFTNMLRNLIENEKPEYIAVCFDSTDPTFRHEAYPEYKKNREEMPEELASQIPLIIDVCEAFNLKVVQLPGYEADDLIGTLAKKSVEAGQRAVIVSNDKDLCQLVRDPDVVCMRHNVQSIRRKKPVPPIEWCDEAWVKKKYGLPPERMRDYLGLAGDSIDNIPGAPGIGAKGAVKLISEFDSAEGVLNNAEQVKHKTYRESLQGNRALIEQSLDLATIKTDVPLKLGLDSLGYAGPDRAEAYKIFRRLEFKELTEEFADAAPKSAIAGRGEAFQKISNIEDLDGLVRNLWETDNWSFHVDQQGIPPDISSYYAKEPEGLAISVIAGDTFYVDLKNFAGDREKAVTALRDILGNKFLNKTVHDLKRNLAVLGKLGISPASVSDDTMIGAYLLDPGRRNYELRTLAQQILKKEIARSIPEGWDANQYRTAESAKFILQVAPHIRDRIESDELGTVYRDIEIPLVPVLFEMEMAGIAVDREQLKETAEWLSVELAKLESEIYQLAGRKFKVNSPKQVGEMLRELGIETGQRTRTGQISTGKDVLSELAHEHEIVKEILRYRELDKLKSTYTDNLTDMIAEDGRIHGILNQTVAATGRLSSTSPNLQNIPVRTKEGRRIRRAFAPAKGHKFIAADYSQLELRLLAHITRDEVMLEAFRVNEDIHAKTAQIIFNARTEKELKDKRRLAKIVNFGIVYVVGARGLSQRIGVPVEEANEIIENYYAKYVGVKEYMDRTPSEARRDGFVSTPFGRRRYFPTIKNRNFSVRSRAEREAVNHPIQGFASDVAKLAMVKVSDALRKRNLESRILMQIHDELLVEAPFGEVGEVRQLLKTEMESAVELDVPLVVDISEGDNWADVA